MQIFYMLYAFFSMLDTSPRDYELLAYYKRNNYKLLHWLKNCKINLKLALLYLILWLVKIDFFAIISAIIYHAITKT